MATAKNDEVVLDAQNWTKLPPIDGLRTDGVFVVENSGWEGGGEPELVLHADGTFEDRSGLSNMVGTTMDFDGVPKAPHRATGGVCTEAGRWKLRIS